MQNRSRLAAKGVAILMIAASTLVARSARAEFPTLERSIQIARQHAIVVADAQAELGVAHAQRTGAGVSALGNPYVDVQIDKGLGTTQEVQALGYAYFPVDIGGQRGARIEEANKFTKWRELGVVDARAIATGETVTAYGEVVIGMARVAQAEAGEATAREEAKYFAGRLESKDTTVYEKSLADAEVARWVQLRAEAQLRLTSGRARFAQLIGVIDIDTPPATTTVEPPGLRASWDDAYVAKVADRSPLVQRLNAEGRYWDASVERYKTERLPPVALELIGGRGTQGEARLGGGVVLTFPVTRRYQGEIARAEQGKTHVATRLSLYRTILQSRLRAARDAIVAVNKATKELDANGMVALERAVSSSVEGFKLGKIEITRVLLARRDLSIARARRLNLLEASWRAYADLTILSGEVP